MNPDDLARILDELGERLGPTGERVFALAVRQVYIEAFVYLVLALVLIVPALLIWRHRGSLDKYDRGPGLVISALLVSMGVLIIAAFALPPVLNPEYAAIRALLGAIRP